LKRVTETTGPNTFAAHDLIALARTRDHRRLEEESLAGAHLAASDHLDMLLLRGAVDEAGNASLARR